MTGSIALDVVIGLVFIYLLYSLFATIIQEMIATMLGFRAKVLEKAILRMLEDGKSTSDSRFGDRFEGLMHLFGKKVDYKDKLVAASFYTHPLIKYLAEDNFHSKPGYLNAQDFSKVLLDLLNGIDQGPATKTITQIAQSVQDGKIKSEVLLTLGEGVAHPLHDLQCSLMPGVVKGGVIPAINSETQLFLKSLLADAEYDLDRFRTLTEKWFDTTMERATGWYKRYIQLILLVIGLAMAIAFNVDTIEISKRLARDPKLREQMVQSASAYLEKEKDLSARIDQIRSKSTLTPLDSATVNDAEQLKGRLDSQISTANQFYNNDLKNVNKQLGLGWGDDVEIKAYTPVGWLLTALAISLGAPFWFDMLNKLMKLRTGAKADADPGADSSKPAVQATAVSVNRSSNTSSDEAVG